MYRFYLTITSYRLHFINIFISGLETLRAWILKQDLSDTFFGIVPLGLFITMT